MNKRKAMYVLMIIMLLSFLIVVGSCDTSNVSEAINNQNNNEAASTFNHSFEITTSVISFKEFILDTNDTVTVYGNPSNMKVVVISPQSTGVGIWIGTDYYESTPVVAGEKYKFVFEKNKNKKWIDFGENVLKVRIENEEFTYKFSVKFPKLILKSPSKAEVADPKTLVFEWEIPECYENYIKEFSLVYQVEEKEYEKLIEYSVHSGKNFKGSINSALPGNAMIFWRVKALLTDGTTVYSNSLYFYTKNTPPQPPELIYPVLGEEVMGNDITFRFRINDEDIIANRRQGLECTLYFKGTYEDRDVKSVSKTVLFGDDTGTEVQLSLSSLLYDRYKWWVVVKDKSVYSDEILVATSLNIGDFIFLPNDPYMVVPIQPSDGECINISSTEKGTEVTLKWKKLTSEKVSGYQIEVDGEELDDITSITEYKGFFESGFHKWRVKSIEGENWSIYSGFTVNAPPTMPEPVSPKNGEEDIKIVPKLSWKAQDPESMELTFDIYLSDNATKVNKMDSDVLVAKKLQTSEYVLEKSLKENTVYYWRVVAYDKCGNKTVGPIWSFKTGVRKGVVDSIKTYGGSGEDIPVAFVKNQNGLYIVANTYSNDGDVPLHDSNYHIWILKIDTETLDILDSTVVNIEGEAISACGAVDGSFILLIKDNNGGKVLVRMNSRYKILWKKTISDSCKDFYSIKCENSDSGIEIYGKKYIDWDSDYYGAKYVYDLEGYLKETYEYQSNIDFNGVLLSGYGYFNVGYIYNDNISKSFLSYAFRGWMYDVSKLSGMFYYSIQSLSGGFIAAGYTLDGDMLGCNSIKSKDAVIAEYDISPKLVWLKCYGGDGEDVAKKISMSTDGYIVVGYSSTNSSGMRDIWIFEIDKEGNIKWSKKVGGSFDDEGIDICILSYNIFMVLGESTSADGNIHSNNGQNDVVVISIKY